jgi:hypothetical protein
MRRVFTLLVCGALSGLATLPAEAVRIKGDLNPTPDGSVDYGDLVVLLRARAGLITLSSEQQEAADVAPQVLGAPTGDQQIDPADVLVFLRYAWQNLDVDRDGLAIEGATSVFASDSDGDGLCDGNDVLQSMVVACRGEIPLGTDATRPDTDNDGICDGPQAHAPTSCASGEFYTGTNPLRKDSDGDGKDDPLEDPDLDGWDQGGETSATDPDTDGDGRCDGTSRQTWDSNGDPVCTGSEHWENSNALVADAPIDPNATEPCPNCFAVFVVPDTQHYVYTGNSMNATRHLFQTMDYICANQNAWREPTTRKVMPIRMVIHLGDLVSNYNTGEPGHVDEWGRIDAAFDRLDACGVPYLVAPGNHDFDPAGDSSSGAMTWYGRTFKAPCDSGACTQGEIGQASARAAWQAHRCTNPYDCQWPNEWFIGNGDDVPAYSRPLNSAPAPTGYGPPNAEPGRHRAGVIRAPNDQRFLFIGLDYYMEAGPTADQPWRSNDFAWVKNLMEEYDGVPTLLFHHSAFGDAGANGPQRMEIWSQLVENYPQVFMGINGHVYAGPAVANQATGGVYRLVRNYQSYNPPPPFNGLQYGDGWQSVLVFDPQAGQIRTRSYRISDVENYKTQWMYDNVSHNVTVESSHTSTNLQPTWLMDTDSGYSCPKLTATFGGEQYGCETILPWDFQ